MNEAEWYKMADEMMAAMADGIDHRVLKELVAEMWKSAAEPERQYMARIMMETAVRVSEHVIQKEAERIVRRTLLDPDSVNKLDDAVKTAFERVVASARVTDDIERQSRASIKNSVERWVQGAFRHAIKGKRFEVDVGRIAVDVDDEDW